MQQAIVAGPPRTMTAASRTYAPTDFSTEKLYSRLSILTQIRKARLKPRIVRGADRVLKKTKCRARYGASGHLVLAKELEGEECILEHEMRHGLQDITNPNGAERITPRKLFRKGNALEVLRRIFIMFLQVGEIYSETPILNRVEPWERNVYMLATSIRNAIEATIVGAGCRLCYWLMARSGQQLPVFPTIALVFEKIYYAVAAMEVGVVVLNAIGAKKLRQATEKYGLDGYLALRLLGCPHPIKSMKILKRLERERILTTQGFTRKGRKWAHSFREKILEFLEKAESQRKQLIEEALK